MNDFLRRLTTPFAASPRRWALVGALLLVMLVLALAGRLV